MVFVRAVIASLVCCSIWGAGLEWPQVRSSVNELQSFVCDERVERYRGRLDALEGHRLDVLTAHLSFENGREHYYDIRQDKHERPGFSSVSGAWSEGEFGTLVRQTERLIADNPVENWALEELHGEPASVVTLHVAAGESPWDLVIEGGGRRSIAFDTTVWVSNLTGQIVKVSRRSTDVPSESGISAIEWNVTLKELATATGTWLVPDTGDYSVEYRDRNHREWNRIYFSNYRRYGAESRITY
jgi:hypothetical protein